MKVLMLVSAALIAGSVFAERQGPWPKEKAWAWYKARPLMRGANYMSKSCCNRVDQWQEYGFEERFREQEEELALAQSIGFNAMRILVLSEGFDVWLQDHDGFMKRFERTLDLLDRHGMGVVLVLGNDCSRPKTMFSLSKLGPQKVDWGYHGGRKVSQHGSLPNEVGYIVADHPTLGPKFFAMCEELMRKYAHDRRIVAWNLWNEPGANNRGEIGLSPLRKIFALAWKVDPDQPVMADLWESYGKGDRNPCENYAGENSDIISYHSYERLSRQVEILEDLKKRYGRPLFITEWLCRMMHNEVAEAYPLYQMEGVSSFMWGFVNGKYQTQEPWECNWHAAEKGLEGDFDFRVWFHDLYRPSLRPYDPKEIAVIRRVNADADAERAGTSLRAKIAKRFPVTKCDMWYGYRRYHFTFDGHEAWVVQPATTTAPGMPWTWTIQWSEHFVERSGVLDLLKRGWHHVFVDGYDERGSDKGIARFAAFQKFLVDELGFAPKTCLAGMSWGGFFSVRYAAAHPQNVAKIYLDAPLLTFAPGFDEELGPWEKAKPADGDWLKDPRMPVNMAAQLAAAKIPILLLYGAQDQSVPPKLNGEKFAEDFRKAGGKIEVDCRWGFGHHPHGLDPNKTEKIAGFFAEVCAALPEKGCLSALGREKMTHTVSPAYRDGVLYGFYQAGERHTVENVDDPTELMRLSVFRPTVASNARTFVDVGVAGQDFGSFVQTTKRPPCAQTAIEKDGLLYLFFRGRRPDDSQLWCYRNFDTRTGKLTDGATICTLDGKEFNGVVARDAYNRVSGDRQTGASLANECNVRLFSDGWYYMIACVGGDCVGLVVRSKNLRDWVSVRATPDLKQGATMEHEIAELAPGKWISAWRQERLGGVWTATCDASTGKWSEPQRVPDSIAVKPCLFAHRGKTYLATNLKGPVTTPGYGTVVRATLGIFEVAADGRMEKIRTIVNPTGCHYVSALEDDLGNLYLCHSTDERKLDASQGRSNIGFFRVRFTEAN